MAQQGGTYRIPTNTAVATRSQASGYLADKINSQESAVEKSGEASGIPAAGTDTVARSNSSSRDRGHDEDKRDDQQWEVVESPEADKGIDSSAGGFSSHFDLQLGWGRWKFTVFSWDLIVSRPAGRNTRR